LSKGGDNLKKISKWLMEQTADISILAGIILLAIGLYMVYIPLALIIPGLFLIYLGWPKGKKVK
jgi:hypothetical protein